VPRGLAVTPLSGDAAISYIIRLNGGIATFERDGRQFVAVASGNATGFWRVPPAASTIIVFGLPSGARTGSN
jgi:hypothetical protein